MTEAAQGLAILLGISDAAALVAYWRLRRQQNSDRLKLGPICDRSWREATHG